MAATAGRRSVAVRLKPPSERGNSSYQAPNTARSRSTHSSRVSLVVRSVGSGTSVRADVSSGVVAVASLVFDCLVGVTQGCDGVVDEGPVVVLQLRPSGLEDEGALLELELDVLAGGVLDGDVVDPGGEPVGPGLDHELVQAQVGGLDRAGPQVVVDLGHRRRPPLRLTLRPPPHPRRQDVVPVAEDVGGNGRRVPDHRLGRVAAGSRSRARADDHDTTGHSYRCTTAGPSPTPAATALPGTSTVQKPAIYAAFCTVTCGSGFCSRFDRL